MLGTHTDSRPPEALQPLSFDNDSVPPHEALDQWCSWLGQLNAIIPEAEATFGARVDYWRLGRFVIANTVSSPVRLVRAPGSARRDGLDHWVLRVSRRGVVRSRSGDRAYVSRPGDLVLERLTGCYDDAWSADDWVALISPPGAFPALDRGLEALAPGPVSGTRGALLADYLLALDRRLPFVTEADVGAVADATRAMIAALAPSGQARSAPSGIVARLRAEQVIRANIASARLDSHRIAALSGVSRSTLYRLFEDDGGVAAHVRRLRLDAVHAALRDPQRSGETIAQIAYGVGFHCVASFNRAFKARFGAAPGEVRADGARFPGEAAADAMPSGADFLDVLFAAKP